MFRASRYSVATSSTVGKAVNSSGFLIRIDVIRIRIDIAIEIDSRTSSRNAGMGRIRRTTMPTMPRAIATSPRMTMLIRSRAVGAVS